MYRCILLLHYLPVAHFHIFQQGILSQCRHLYNRNLLGNQYKHCLCYHGFSHSIQNLFSHIFLVGICHCRHRRYTGPIANHIYQQGSLDTRWSHCQTLAQCRTVLQHMRYTLSRLFGQSPTNTCLARTVYTGQRSNDQSSRSIGLPRTVCSPLTRWNLCLPDTCLGHNRYTHRTQS